MSDTLQSTLTDSQFFVLRDRLHSAYQRLTDNVTRRERVVHARIKSGYDERDSFTRLKNLQEDSDLLFSMFEHNPADVIVFLAPLHEVNARIVNLARGLSNLTCSYRLDHRYDMGFKVTQSASGLRYTKGEKCFLFAVPNQDSAEALRELANVRGVLLIGLDTSSILQSDDVRYSRAKAVYSHFESEIEAIFPDIPIPRSDLEIPALDSCNESMFFEPFRDIIARAKSEAQRQIARQIRQNSDVVYQMIADLECRTFTVRCPRSTGDSFCAYDMLTDALLTSDEDDSQAPVVSIIRSFFEQKGCTFSDHSG